MKTTTNPRRTAPVTAALLVACLAALARGESPAAPRITPVVDMAAQAKAKARGEALLAKPTWNAELNISNLSVTLVGRAVICGGMVHAKGRVATSKTIAMDARTGRTYWDIGKQVPGLSAYGPLAWSDGGLLNLQPGDGTLKLLRWSPEAPDGSAPWETTYTPPAAPKRGNLALRIIPMFAGEQIIAGQQALTWMGPVGPGGLGGGMPNDSKTQAPLTIRSFDRSTGKLQWETPVPVPANTATVLGVEQGRVYIQVLENRPFSTNVIRNVPTTGFFMALNAADGKMLWRTESDPMLDPDNLEAAPHGATLYTFRRPGEIVAYDGQTGKQAWRTRLSPDCDPAKPASGLLSHAKVFADSERVYVYFNAWDLTVASQGEIVGQRPGQPKPISDRARAAAKAEGGIAVLDPRTGIQTGFFNGKGFIVGDSDDQWVTDFAVQGDLLLAQVRKLNLSNNPVTVYVAIDRRTLQLQFTSTSIMAMSDGLVYINASANEDAPQKIVAVQIGQK